MTLRDEFKSCPMMISPVLQIRNLHPKTNKGTATQPIEQAMSEGIGSLNKQCLKELVH
jgi:hypothetical protein